jgi:sodium-coupled neutral amino acid transporter 7/8
VYAELHRPTLTRFGLVTFLATLICTILYSLTGSYGYLTFKHDVNSDVLVNYRHDDAVATSARVFIVIVVFSTFAICQFVGRYVLVHIGYGKGIFLGLLVDKLLSCKAHI